MAEKGPGPDAWGNRRRGGGPGRRKLVVRPDDWPRYLLMKRLKNGATSYYWNPPPRDIKAGFTLSPEALGQSLVAACERAAELNRHLDAWRKSRGAEKDLDLQP